MTTAHSPRLENRFARLVSKWKRETGHLSAVEKISMHPSYQQIIGMGSDALPLIFAELKEEPDHWFWALRAITGADPVPEASRGKVKQMIKLWIAWGRKHGYAR